MKIKGLAVITFLLLACSFAAAGNWTFGFTSVYGGLYCNYIVLDNNNVGGVAGIPAGGPVYEGDDILTACGLSYNATVGGFGPYTLPKGVTFYGYKVVVSKGVVYGDNIFDAENLSYTGAQWTVAQALTCSSKPPAKNKEWWIGVASISSFVFGDNAGPVECNIPRAGGKHLGMMTTGTAARK
jgi:hypothetical protein